LERAAIAFTFPSREVEHLAERQVYTAHAQGRRAGGLQHMEQEVPWADRGSPWRTNGRIHVARMGPE
jgi:hypothetical protein